MPEPTARQPARALNDGALDGPALARAFEGAASALRAQADALNAINVFPVPDGDTGTNMSLTLRAAAAAGSAHSAEGPGAVARAIADGALMGAKGNSGVISSQIIAGFARAAADGAAIDGAAVAQALILGRDAAYAVVSVPKEGTILTAATAAAEAARRTADDGGTPAAVLRAAADAAADAAARTPDLLPVLREAGVVDAGAQGLAVLLDGMVRGLLGEAPSPVRELGAIDAGWLAATERTHAGGEQSGFCTEFVLLGDAIDPDALRRSMLALGDCVLVVGGGSLARVHVHTRTPDDAFAAAEAMGAVSQRKAEDMEAQFQALAGRGRHDAGPAPAGGAIAVVAVGAGDGIVALLRSMGAHVVEGGQTMNPSAGDIRAAIERAATPGVIVLPNNKNILLAAEQAARSLGGAADVRVVPSRTLPQGVAALVALNTEATLDDNVAAMREAIAGVRTAEVTHAARAVTVSGVAVAEGQPIALLDGELALAAATVPEAALTCIDRMLAEGGALVTLYVGEGASADEAATLADAVRERSGVDVEVVEGGQPHYPYVIGVEA